jgi:hypothetical protein
VRAALVVGLLPIACSRTETPRPAPIDAAPAEAAPAPVVVVDAAPPPPPAEPPRGTARLVIQHVEARCYLGPGDEHRFTVGYDLLLETKDDAVDAGEPERDHVFCSKHLADGGTTKPRLGIWRNCREDKKTCAIVSEAGSDPTEVQCGKDTVTLELKDGKTILRGPFGERMVAPHPMTIGAPVRIKRIAEVDC